MTLRFPEKLYRLLQESPSEATGMEWFSERRRGPRGPRSTVYVNVFDRKKLVAHWRPETFVRNMRYYGFKRVSVPVTVLTGTEDEDGRRDPHSEVREIFMWHHPHFRPAMNPHLGRIHRRDSAVHGETVALAAVDFEGDPRLVREEDRIRTHAFRRRPSLGPRPPIVDWVLDGRIRMENRVTVFSYPDGFSGSHLMPFLRPFSEALRAEGCFEYALPGREDVSAWTVSRRRKRGGAAAAPPRRAATAEPSTSLDPRMRVLRLPVREKIEGEGRNRHVKHVFREPEHNNVYNRNYIPKAGAPLLTSRP